MITGISGQVFVLLVFAVVGTDFFVRRFRSSQPLLSEGQALLKDKKFRIFALALAFVYVLILIRCVYRIAEMVGGWRNPIMQDEALFIGLDSWWVLSLPIHIACLLTQNQDGWHRNCITIFRSPRNLFSIPRLE